jgi:hypothetical protein
MSAVSTLWRQLVQRRLLPVAILLIAGLVAVPLLLAKDPDPVPAPPPAQVDTKSELANDPIVTAATAEEASKRRKVLGAAKNPFAVAEEPAPEATAPAADPAGSAAPESPAPEAGGTPAGGSAPSSDVTAPSVPTTPTEPAPAPKKYAPGELTVRFGDGEEVKRRSLEKLEALPSSSNPVLIYTGLLKDGKVAEFLVDSGVEAIGDGECNPSPDACETLRLREGETEFLDIKDETGAVVAQYQIDLVEIHNAGGGSASKAKSARTTKAVRAIKAKAAKARASRSELRSVAVAGTVLARLP